MIFVLVVLNFITDLNIIMKDYGENIAILQVVKTIFIYHYQTKLTVLRTTIN